MWNSGPQIDAPTVKWSQQLRGTLSENKLEYSCVLTAVIGQISVGASFSRGTGKKQGNPKGLWYAGLYNKARARRHQVGNIHVSCSADFYCCPGEQLRVCSSADTVRQVGLVNWEVSQVPGCLVMALLAILHKCNTHYIINFLLQWCASNCFLSC